ncbi:MULTISPECIES: alpha/beta fold hydrolase [Chryseobacterium]|uniref:3-oxoadipate enol-lactonase n=1 Tax=Chryseobacterium camelliae TaxID=1265445 RepID=A0ABU0THH4_9FLAO|nr:MULTISPECIES: alpha/beta hydrolase [Chryseobacterium]MDT3405685.1 3-oxoadipate enol-lactonase [Pseudacidovorax intermedius]MDQ1096507.1 3-oxoadipate enol-lactonase [Chryseobacterium camelliae]MDQ1100448.1 3-oxoadipate enol-lactonase [Chryseobacterium sp. SORGH_AS_1048]MDR6087788.1 3-oxoadipate enol-lactonase [Chryseobacterium sp. SORGH_AS_0909]MDR6132164.1 3-oxoadipate enol-lactonase [Chryseobacterium sp. SORGH_AS_1175]
MELIKINGIELNTEIKGSGKPLLLIHGIGGNLKQLDIIANPLSELFRTISFDLRGHGASSKPREYTLQDHIQDVLAVMDYYSDETAYILGGSMGSYIAQGVAIAAPERITKMVLTVPKSHGATSSVQRLLTEHKKEIEGKSFHDSVLALLKYCVYDPEKMKDHIDLLETGLTPEEFAAANKAIAGFDFRKDLPKVRAETLVISGAYDGLNPVEEGREVASLIPNARFIEMKFSGHAPMYEEPELYLTYVKDFLLS